MKLEFQGWTLSLGTNGMALTFPAGQAQASINLTKSGESGDFFLSVAVDKKEVFNKLVSIKKATQS